MQTVLGPSRSDLGRFWVPSEGQNRAVAHTGLVFLKNHVLEQIGCQEASWVDLESIWGGFGSPKGVQNESRGGSEEKLS